MAIQTHRQRPTEHAKHAPKPADRQAGRTFATNSATWRRIRAAQLAREPLCRICGRKGIAQVANTVDHIDGDATHDEESNYQSLCKPHHDAKTAMEAGTFGRAQTQPKWLEKPCIPFMVVYGPPASGKSSYVAKHSNAHDLVLDLDVMIAANTGLPMYQAEKKHWIAALRERNYQLGRLARSTCGYRRCWLIVTGKTPAERAYWERLATKAIMVDPGKATCMARVMADPRRSDAVKAAHMRVIRAWW